MLQSGNTASQVSSCRRRLSLIPLLLSLLLALLPRHSSILHRAVTTPKRPPLIASSSNPAVAAAIPSRRRTRPTPRPRVTHHEYQQSKHPHDSHVRIEEDHNVYFNNHGDAHFHDHDDIDEGDYESAFVTTITLNLPSSIGDTSSASCTILLIDCKNTMIISVG